MRAAALGDSTWGRNEVYALHHVYLTTELMPPTVLREPLCLSGTLPTPTPRPATTICWMFPVPPDIQPGPLERWRELRSPNEGKAICRFPESLRRCRPVSAQKPAHPDIGV